MSYHLKEAILSIQGVSEIADVIIARRYPDLLEELELEDTVSVSSVDEDLILDSEVDDIIDDVGSVLDGKTATTRELRRMASIVAKLVDRIRSLEDAIDAKLIDAENDETDDETINYQRAEFRDTLQGKTAYHLIDFYDENMLMSMKPKTRYIVASELIDHFASIERTPSKLWTKIIQTRGVI